MLCHLKKSVNEYLDMARDAKESGVEIKKKLTTVLRDHGLGGDDVDAQQNGIQRKDCSTGNPIFEAYNLKKAPVDYIVWIGTGREAEWQVTEKFEKTIRNSDRVNSVKLYRFDVPFLKDISNLKWGAITAITGRYLHSQETLEVANRFVSGISEG